MKVDRQTDRKRRDGSHRDTAFKVFPGGVKKPSRENNSVGGFSIRRKGIGRYIVDVYCPSVKLVVALDCG